MPCRCNQCSKEPAETWTEAFKQECLKRHREKYQAKAREVMMYSEQRKLKYYAMFAEKRGEENANKFIEEVNRQWKLKEGK